MKAVSPMDISNAVSRLIALQGMLISVGIAVFSYVAPGWIAEARGQGTAEAPADELEDANEGGRQSVVVEAGTGDCLCACRVHSAQGGTV